MSIIDILLFATFLLICYFVYQKYNNEKIIKQEENEILSIIQKKNKRVRFNDKKEYFENNKQKKICVI